MRRRPMPPLPSATAERPLPLAHTGWLHFACALALLLIVPAVAAAGTIVLGNDGALFRVHEGTLGTLLDDAPEADAGRDALLLEMRPADGPAVRTLVPGTDDAQAEREAELVYSRDTGHVVLYWKTAAGVNRGPTLHVTSFDGVDWQPVERITATEAAVPGTVQILPAQDAYDLFLEEGDTTEVVRSHRTVLHVVWQVAGDDGPAMHYAPLLFPGGRYLGWHEAIDLTAASALADDAPAEARGSIQTAAALDSHRRVDVLDDGAGLHVAFVHPHDATLVDARIHLLPLELTYLSDQIHGALRTQDAAFASGDFVAVADSARHIIIAVGAQLHLESALIDYVAQQLDAWINTYGAGHADVDVLAAAARTYVLDLVARLLAPNDSDGVIQIDAGGLFDPVAPTAGEGEMRAVLDVRLAGRHALPPIDGTLATFYTSPDGASALIAWLATPPVTQGGPSGQGILRYVERLDDGGWSATRSLPFELIAPEGTGDALRDLDVLLALIEQRVR